MTIDDFKSLEIGERIVMSDRHTENCSHATVIGYTGIKVKFDDGLIWTYEFKPHIAEAFERETK